MATTMATGTLTDEPVGVTLSIAAGRPPNDAPGDAGVSRVQGLTTLTAALLVRGRTKILAPSLLEPPIQDDDNLAGVCERPTQLSVSLRVVP